LGSGPLSNVMSTTLLSLLIGRVTRRDYLVLLVSQVIST